MGQSAGRSWISLVFIAVELNRCLAVHSRDDRAKQLHHILFDRFGIGPPEFRLKRYSPLLLFPGHPSLTTQRTVGEVIDEPRLPASGEMEVTREVLGILKRFKSIYRNRFSDLTAVQGREVMQKTLSADTGEIPSDRIVGDPKVPADLTQTAAADGHACDSPEEAGFVKPVGHFEGCD